MSSMEDSCDFSPDVAEGRSFIKIVSLFEVIFFEKMGRRLTQRDADDSELGASCLVR